MTSASPNTNDESKEFSTDHGTVYLTGSEIERIESDPVLTVPDVVQYRAGGSE